MPSIREQLLFVRDGGHTLRYHTVHRIEHERVGQHSFGVAWLCYLLSPQVVSPVLLMHALGHDVAEWQTGDIPAPTKFALGIKEAVDTHEAGLMEAMGFRWPDLTTAEERLLKLADAMDGMLSCTRERALGNTLIKTCYVKFAEYARNLLDDEAPAEAPEYQLYLAISELWKEANQ